MRVAKFVIYLIIKERKGRFFTDFTLEGFREFMKELPEFRMTDHWETGDVRPGRGDERWLNMILKRTGRQVYI